MRSGDHGGLAGLDGGEEVTVRDQTHALVPRVVCGSEVSADIESGGQLPGGALLQRRPGPRRVTAAQLVDQRGGARVLPPDRPVGPAGRQQLAEQVSDRIGVRHRQDVGRRALQPRHAGRGTGDGRQDSGGRRAAADQHHPPAGQVEVVGPFLRMHDHAAEAGQAWPVRRVALVIAVVARAQVQKSAGALGPGAGPGVLRHHGPARLRSRPVGRHDLAGDS